MTIVEISVHMDCAGCETKIKKALLKLTGVDDVDVDINMQKVTVMGWANQEKVLKTVRKTGRRAELWPYPYNPEYHGFMRHYGNDRHKDNAKEITTYYSAPKSSSSNYNYNYYEHGYKCGEDHGYYHKPVYSTLVDEKTMAVFSDENPHACSVM